MNTDSNQTLDIADLIKKPLPTESRHINLRLSGADVRIYKFLKEHFPDITDSLRIRDCVRIAAFLFAMRNNGKPITMRVEGVEKDLLEHMGAFAPQTPMDTRKSTRKRSG
jgi:hypothetical protein